MLAYSGYWSHARYLDYVDKRVKYWLHSADRSLHRKLPRYDRLRADLIEAHRRFKAAERRKDAVAMRRYLKFYNRVARMLDALDAVA